MKALRLTSLLVLVLSALSVHAQNYVYQFGVPFIDQPVPGDYDGDGRADLALYRKSTAEWVIRTWDGKTRRTKFGVPNVDLPVAADYDGDKKTDLATYREFSGEWTILGSTKGLYKVKLGGPRFEPLPADYQGRGYAQLGVFYHGLGGYENYWLTRDEYGNVKRTDVTFDWYHYPNPDPIVGDMDADGRDDMGLADHFGNLRVRYAVGYLESNTYSGSPYGMVLEDLDGDGFDDVCGS